MHIEITFDDNELDQLKFTVTRANILDAFVQYSQRVGTMQALAAVSQQANTKEAQDYTRLMQIARPFEAQSRVFTIFGHEVRNTISYDTRETSITTEHLETSLRVLNALSEQADIHITVKGSAQTWFHNSAYGFAKLRQHAGESGFDFYARLIANTENIQQEYALNQSVMPIVSKLRLHHAYTRLKNHVAEAKQIYRKETKWRYSSASRQHAQANLDELIRQLDHLEGSELSHAAAKFTVLSYAIQKIRDDLIRTHEEQLSHRLPVIKFFADRVSPESTLARRYDVTHLVTHYQPDVSSSGQTASVEAFLDQHNLISLCSITNQAN